MLNQNQQIFEQIKKADNILITFNKAWDGDAVASSLAMYLFLKKLEKKVTIAAEKIDNSDIYKFLPAYGEIISSLKSLRKFIISLDTSKVKVEKIKYKIEDNRLDFIISPQNGFFSHEDIKSRAGDFKYDLVIILNTPDLESLGSVYESDTEFFYQIPIINIDHHADNENFGQINYIELTATATSELLFNIFSDYSRDLIDENIATCLLAGIITETKSFKTKNITPQTLSAAAQLITMGARREEIVNQLYRSRSVNVLKLWGRVLARLNNNPDKSIIWSILSNSDFYKTGTNENDLKEIIEELISNIPQAKIIVIIYETREIPKMAQLTEEQYSVTKALIYTAQNINALNLIKQWQPIGTKNLAKISIPLKLAEAEKIISETIKENLSRLPI